MSYKPQPFFMIIDKVDDGREYDIEKLISFSDQSLSDNFTHSFESKHMLHFTLL